MSLIKELAITKFRGIHNLELANLGNINLLIGDNNSGKTSVLEAIQILAAPFNPSTYVRVGRVRNLFPSLNKGESTLDSLLWLFPMSMDQLNLALDRAQIGFNATIRAEKIQLTIECFEKKFIKSDFPSYGNDILDGNDESAQMSVYENTPEYEVRSLEFSVELLKNAKQTKKTFKITEGMPFVPIEKTMSILDTQFITPVDHRVRSNLESINESIISGEQHKLVEALKIFDENITGIQILAPKGKPVPYIDHKVLGLTPVYVFGDGLRKALTLASEVVRCKNGVLLIDELETAVHTKALGKLFSWLVDTCKRFNVQLFATTHSLEAIDAVIEANEEQLNTLVAYRLEVVNGATMAKQFSGETLHDLRFDLGQEVR
jgi:AAA15 family ATPase/GTPase